ncbi:MAG: peptidase domain-containing ABC transporter [Herminiimonas sp.]|nr:peptidase domain-containing ABC transporter [Herminiimonas sp.]
MQPFLERLSLGLGRRLPVILQTEATECGLACVGMVAHFHGYRTDLASLRRRFQISLKGATLAHLMQFAGSLQMGTRALKLGLDNLGDLRLPCILHWNFNHFVVLKEVNARSITIHDPGFGARVVPRDEVSQAFTGVALELWPNPAFEAKPPEPKLALNQLLGRVTGLARSFTQILLLALGIEVFALVAPFYLQWVVDHAIVAADRDLLTTLGLGFGLLLLMQQAVTSLRSWVIMHMGTTMNLQWRANVFTHLLRLPVSYFEKRHLGDVLSRFGAIDTIQKTLTTSFLEAVLDGVMTSVTLVLMFIYSPTLAWIAIGTMALYALARWCWYRPLREATAEQIVHAAKQQSHFIESIRGIRAVKLFQRQDARVSAWLSLLVDQINADLRLQKLQIFYQGLNKSLFGIENLLIIWLGARLILDGSFTVGMLLAFHAYKSQFDARMSALIDKLSEFKMLQLQGERLADVVMTNPESLEGQGLYLVENATASQHAGTTSITVSNLQFRYGDHEPLTLDNLSFHIAAGESVAIVGPSGSGKTTLLSLMLGMLSPTSGDILIGGKSMSQIGLSGLRQIVGTVLQDDVLFAGSIMDNICFFDPHPDLPWAMQCTQMASIAAEISAMPMGFHTQVGDMGTVLSGGQKQRVLLARALYKRPKILLLDEATSHLDVACEQQVNSAIRNLSITRIIIAHRPETIASAQRVLTLVAGRLVDDALTAAGQEAH